MDALRRVCDQQGIFTATFEPMTDLSLSELKHAATAPMRLLAHLKRCSLNGHTPRLCTRILENSELVGRAFESFILVPGGRFLVTCTQTVMQLWDLGYTPKAIIGPCPVVSIDIEAGSEAPCLIGLRAASDGSGLRIILELK